MVVVADSERMRKCMAPDRRREPCVTSSREHRHDITHASPETPNAWRQSVLCEGVLPVPRPVRKTC
jgi:hypothetical protein